MSNTTEQLVINNGKVQVVQTTVLNEMTIERFMQEAVDRKPVQTPLMPVGTIFYAESNKNISYLVHIPRHRRLLNFKYARVNEADAPLTHNVPIADCILSIKFTWNESSKMHTWTTPSLHYINTDKPTLGTQLLECPLPNVHNGGGVCTGSISIPAKTEPTQVVNTFREVLLTAVHNTDLAFAGMLPGKFYDGTNVRADDIEAVMKRWEELTLNEYCKLPFRSQCTIQDKINQLLAN